MPFQQLFESCCAIALFGIVCSVDRSHRFNINPSEESDSIVEQSKSVSSYRFLLTILMIPIKDNLIPFCNKGAPSLITRAYFPNKAQSCLEELMDNLYI